MVRYFIAPLSLATTAAPSPARSSHRYELLEHRIVRHTLLTSDFILEETQEKLIEKFGANNPSRQRRERNGMVG